MLSSLFFILVLNSFGTELDVLRNADLSNTDVKVKHVITITIISKGVQAFFWRQREKMREGSCEFLKKIKGW